MGLWGSDRVFDGFMGFTGVFERNKAAGGKSAENHESLIEKYENPGHSAGFLGFYEVIGGV